MEKKPVTIYTVGYPRSGNTWLIRLLSDALSSPIKTFLGEPLEYAGGRGGVYLIHKTHWPIEAQEGLDRDLRVLIQRDPRDVAVSAMFYTGSSLMDALKTMCDPRFKTVNPIYHLPGYYRKFVEGWMGSERKLNVVTRYEWLHDREGKELHFILKELLGLNVDPGYAQSVWNRQAFSVVKNTHRGKSDTALRKGVVGEWKKYFTRRHAEYTHQHLWDFMIANQYELNEDWWEELPDEA